MTVRVHTNVTWIDTLTALPPGNSIQNSGYTIYPTSISGIGISINERDTSHTSYTGPISVWPNYTAKTSHNNDGALIVDMKLWKIPGNLPTTSGALQFTGPMLNLAFRTMSAADAYRSDQTPLLDDRTLVIANRILTGSLTLLNSICELSGGNRTVELGQAMPTSIFKLAARFVQTDADVEAGDAKTSVEVIASYN